MFSERLNFALREIGRDLIPTAGKLAVFNANRDTAACFPKEQTQFIERFRPAWDELSGAGYDMRVEPEAEYVLAVVRIPRSKLQARDMIARAARASQGTMIVDGQKTDGIDGIIKGLRGTAEVETVVSKAHGKLAIVRGGDFSEWIASDIRVEGFLTRAGVFSAERVDPGSRLLADTLPKQLKGCVGDFGAGWGYLSRRVTDVSDVQRLDLIEADLVALDCARENVPSDRARFYWADVRRFQPESLYDTIVMNPPFHSGREADIELGAGFIASAARNLARSGQLWMVANRHLPYEKVLAAHFRNVHELQGDRSYKLFRAEHAHGRA